MLKRKFGPEELQSRVFARTILVRKSPTDERFPEFYELTEYEKNQTEKTSTHQMGLKGDATWDDFQCLHQLSGTRVNKLVFAEGSAEQDEDPMKLCGFPTPKNASKAIQPGTGSSSEAGTMPASRPEPQHSIAASVSSMVLSHLENSLSTAGQGNSLAGEEGNHKTQQALLKVKNCCYQAKGMMEEKASEDKKFAKKVMTPLKDLSEMIKLLEKCKNPARKGVAFELIHQAAKLMKKHYRMFGDE